MSTPDRVVKTKIPARIIVSSTRIGLFVIGFIIVAVWQSGRGIVDARQRGTIISKEFRQTATEDREITISRTGALVAKDATGEYLLTVRVPQRGEPPKTYTVWLNDRQWFESLSVGDPFDVGPFLVPSKK